MTGVPLKVEDYVFGGFWSDRFPLGNAVQTTAVLNQRALTSKHVEKNDLRARVYYNLIVFFRLLWHHRLLEPTPHFWEYITEDFPAKGLRQGETKKVALHYVSACIAYINLRDDKKGTECFLSRLVDQWRSRPHIEKATTGQLQNPQVAASSLRRARMSWNAVLRRDESKLIRSKELNWPVFSLPLVDRMVRFISSLSNSKADPHPTPKQKDEAKRLSNPTRAPTLADVSEAHKLGVPPITQTQGEGVWRPESRLTSPSIERRNVEPGRLTPPVELQLARQQTMASNSSGPLTAGRGNVSASPTSKGNTSLPATPSKRPVSRSGELSPFSKRRLIKHEQVDGATERVPATAGIVQPPQQSCSTNDGGTIVLQPSTEPQSLEEMIATVTRSASAAEGYGTKPTSLPDVIADSSGRATEVRDMEAQVVEASGHRLLLPVITGRDAPMILIDVPATIFELARRIEDLEMKAAEGQAGIQATISRLACRVAKLEQKSDCRDNVSTNVAAGVSALTCTISNLERTLGDAVDVRATTVALTSRITGLEWTIDVKIDAQNRRIADIQNTVEAQFKAQGIKEDGEIVETNGFEAGQP